MNGQHWTIVLAGGQGSRLRDLTRRLYDDDRPKQFCALVDERTLVEHTIDRGLMFAPIDRTIVSLVQGQDRWHSVMAAYHGLQFSLQPSAAGTGAAVLWAAIAVARQDALAKVLLLPSDHVVSPDHRLREHLEMADRWLGRFPGHLVVLGVPARRPDPDLGWLAIDDDDICTRGPVRPARLIEKPSPDEAERLYRRGAYWNTMMTVFGVKGFLELSAELTPGWLAALTRASEGSASLRQAYRTLAPFDFSRDVLGRAGRRLGLLPLKQVDWHDIGREDRLEALLAGRGIPAP